MASTKTIQLNSKHKHFPKPKYSKRREPYKGLTHNMVNNVGLFSVNSHVKDVCNFASLQFYRLCQATTGSSFCKSPLEIDYKPKKFKQLKNESNIQVVCINKS